MIGRCTYLHMSFEIHIPPHTHTHTHTRMHTHMHTHTHTHTQDTDSIAVGPFLVSPKEFYISASGGCVDVSIVFTPPKIGTFTHELHMACDNGQVLTYTLTGTR